MPEIPNSRRLPWRRRPSKGFRKDGSTFAPFRGAKSSGDSRYSSKHWRSLRVRVLEAYPVCLPCMDRGCMEASVEVDHIVPHTETEDFYDEANLWALCKSCHATKSGYEGGGKRAPSDGGIDPRAYWIKLINKNK